MEKTGHEAISSSIIEPVVPYAWKLSPKIHKCRIGLYAASEARVVNGALDWDSRNLGSNHGLALGFMDDLGPVTESALSFSS